MNPPYAEALSHAVTANLMWTFLGLFTVIALLFIRTPAGRGRLKTAALLGLAAGAGLLAAAVLHLAGLDPESPFYRVVRYSSLMLLSVSCFNASGVFVFDDLAPAFRLRLPSLARDLLLAGGYAIAAFILLAEGGVDPRGIIATSAVVTAALAFALQETLVNLLCGMVIQLEQSPSPGDFIRIPGIEEGRVHEIRWRKTTLETSEGNTIDVPNSTVMKGHVTILGRRAGKHRQYLRSITFNVPHDRPPDVVIAEVEQALRAEPPPHVSRNSHPICLVNDFKENHAVYLARYWLTDFANDLETDSAMRVRVYYALARMGVSLSIPGNAAITVQTHRELRQRGHDEETARRIAALKGVELFNPLKPEELSLLAERLRPAPFTRGEPLTRQGAAAEWLYILVRGDAEVRLHASDGAAQSVAHLKSGEVLGEMGLLTGEPRSATVVASTDVDCYRLDRESFADIVAKRPEIAEGISLILARRRVGLDAAREGLAAESQRLKLAQTQGAMLTRIRKFLAMAQQ